MDWFAIEILTGLQKLACCSWDRTPAAEILPGTAQVWIEALSRGRKWEESRDVPRIRDAFVVLAQTCERWPAPKQFLASLPDSTQLRIAGPGERPFDPPELVEAIEAVKRGDVMPIRSLDELRGVLAAAYEPVEKLTQSEAAAELHAHYSDRKSAAAGDQ